MKVTKISNDQKSKSLYYLLKLNVQFKIKFKCREAVENYQYRYSGHVVQDKPAAILSPVTL